MNDDELVLEIDAILDHVDTAEDSLDEAMAVLESLQNSGIDLMIVKHGIEQIQIVISDLQEILSE